MEPTKLTKLENLEEAIKIGKRIKTLCSAKNKYLKRSSTHRIEMYDEKNYDRCELILSTSLVLQLIENQIEEELQKLLQLGFTL